MSQTSILGKAFAALIALCFLYAAFAVYMVGQPLFGVILTMVGLCVFLVFSNARFYFARFIFPGIATMALFVLFPIFYTIYLGFTNYGSFNLLSYERVKEVILENRVIDSTSARPFNVILEETGSYRIYFAGTPSYISQPLTLDGSSENVDAFATKEITSTFLERRDTIKLRAALAEISVTMPDGTELRAKGLRDFAAITPEFVEIDDNTLENTQTGAKLIADHESGFFKTEVGETVAPGWRVNIGLKNFDRIFNSDGIRGPIISIFVWTVAFALISVIVTFALGLLLANLLQWEHLRFKAIYRILLILPYAVPSFISILVFRGLFNQNFGEINMILEAVFGLGVDWNSNGSMARIMLVIVNAWLGYPYMMLLAMGFLQSVPAEQKKAALIEGAGPVLTFFKITLPQIIPPFLPLLLASFAFNFNNIVLVLLLTGGGPDIPGTVIQAGETDILGSFTYRIAFMDSGTQFGLAGAITMLIFILVSIMAYANFVAMRRAVQKGA